MEKHTIMFTGGNGLSISTCGRYRIVLIQYRPFPYSLYIAQVVTKAGQIIDISNEMRFVDCVALCMEHRECCRSALLNGAA